MVKILLLLLIGILLCPGKIYSADQQFSYHHLSVRILGLTHHVIDVTYNAEYFPLKFDQKAQNLLNPGILTAFDKPLNRRELYWRTTLSFYIDCAVQPAGYLATMIFKQPIFRYQKLSAGFGFGAGIDIRRSWTKFGQSGIETRLFKDWGAVEGFIGPYSEVELAYQLSDRKQLVLNLVPAYPILVFVTIGLRTKLTDINPS